MAAPTDLHESKRTRCSYPSQPDTNTTRPENAHQQVASARARLSHTTKDYLAACQLLASSCVMRPWSPGQPSRELVLSAIDMELSNLMEEVELIQNAHKVLINARNRAKMTAPVYSLPPEILTRIFLDAACHHAHDELKPPNCVPSSPVTLSAVCKQWRTVATNSRALWAHLDILIDGTNRRPRYPPSQLWIRYLQETPLRIHIRQCSPTLRQHPGTSAGTQYPVSRTLQFSLSNLTNFLIPLMSHVDTLELISSVHCQSFLYSMLDHLIDSDEDPIPMRAVRIIHDQDEDCNPLQFKMSHSLIDPYFEDHKTFFSSLVTLDLRNAYPRWSHLTLTNLVEFRFEVPNIDNGFSVTQVELASTLASCPKLRSLMLFGLSVTPAPAGTILRPVVLRDLRVLSLRFMAWEGDLKRTIAMIYPGPHPLHLSVHLPDEFESRPGFLAELR
ncbi:hypothetical protein FRC08_008353, partial [Ceratobasidium sp. 394]